MPPFHGERLRLRQLICDITEQEVSQWTANKPFAIRPALEHCLVDYITTHWLRAKATNSTTETLPLFFTRFLDLSLLWQRFPSLRRSSKLMNSSIQKLVTAGSKSILGKSVLSLLLTAHDEAGQLMTDEEIRDELMTLVMAGYETTTTALVWAIYWTIKLEIRDKLKSELIALVYSSPIEIATALSCRVCSEALRIYSITGFTFDRVVKVPLKLMG